MAELFNGAPVAAEIRKSLIEKLNQVEKTVGLGIIRMGSEADDIAYEKSIIKHASQIGIQVKITEIPDDINSEAAISLIEALNQDNSIDGILIFRPMFNSGIEKLLVKYLAPEKDVDGITSASMVKQYSGLGEGFNPCTAEACMKILSYYGVDLGGKKVVVIGRSQVIGKPVAMMMLEENATVTICHSRTKDLKETVKAADLVIAAIGKDRFINEEYLSEGQIIVDVGINFNEEGVLHGDVDFESAKDIVAAITPVPGGVGSVTTSLLFAHTLEASKGR